MLAKDVLGRVLCAGVFAFFTFSVFQNAGMTMGIMPVTGIPLPFLSYGGSAALVFFIGHRPRPLGGGPPWRMSPSEHAELPGHGGRPSVDVAAAPAPRRWSPDRGGAALPDRSLIPVGLAEERRIALAQRAIARPATEHATSCSARSSARLDVDVDRRAAHRRAGGVFHAELDLMTPAGPRRLDCRPSDGIVLALRQTVPAPILADERLLGGRCGRLSSGRLAGAGCRRPLA